MVRKIMAKLVLQLRAEGLSGRAISHIAGRIPQERHGGAVEAADATSTSWAKVSGMSEGEVYALLFPGRGDHQSVFAQAE